MMDSLLSTLEKTPLLGDGWHKVASSLTSIRGQLEDADKHTTLLRRRDGAASWSRPGGVRPSYSHPGLRGR